MFRFRLSPRRVANISPRPVATASRVIDMRDMDEAESPEAAFILNTILRAESPEEDMRDLLNAIDKKRAFNGSFSDEAAYAGLRTQLIRVIESSPRVRPQRDAIMRRVDDLRRYTEARKAAAVLVHALRGVSHLPNSLRIESVV